MREASALVANIVGRKILLGGQIATHVLHMLTLYLHVLLPLKAQGISSFCSLQHYFGILKRKAKKTACTTRKCSIQCPFSKIGYPISDQTTQLVKEFYISPDNSRPSPNQRDVVFVEREKVNGVTEVIRAGRQETLVSSHHLYHEFRACYPDNMMSFSTFVRLKPKLKGFHTGFTKSCLCVYHTNFELLLVQLILGDTPGRC